MSKPGRERSGSPNLRAIRARRASNANQNAAMAATNQSGAPTPTISNIGGGWRSKSSICQRTRPTVKLWRFPPHDQRPAREAHSCGLKEAGNEYRPHRPAPDAGTESNGPLVLRVSASRAAPSADAASTMVLAPASPPTRKCRKSDEVCARIMRSTAPTRAVPEMITRRIWSALIAMRVPVGQQWDAFPCPAGGLSECGSEVSFFPFALRVRSSFTLYAVFLIRLGSLACRTRGTALATHADRNRTDGSNPRDGFGRANTTG